MTYCMGGANSSKVVETTIEKELNICSYRPSYSKHKFFAFVNQKNFMWSMSKQFYQFIKCFSQKENPSQ